jgi:hypothetical protein
MKRWTLEEINILSKTAPNWELCKELLKDRTEKAMIKKYYELRNIKKTEVIKETPKKESFIKRLFKKLFV